MMEIYALKLKGQLNNRLFTYLLQYVEESKRIKIKRFVKWEDAHRALFAELLIRYLIISKLKINNNDISFSTNDYKKPFLDNIKDFHFNLSHSGSWMVCALDQYPVGIDVELIKTIDLKIAKRFFPKEESEELLSKEESKRTDFFFTLWTLKESYMKATGKGLYLPLSSFSVKFDKEDRIFIISEGKKIKNMHLKMYGLDHNYKLSVCAAHNQFPKSINIIKCDTIIDYFKVKCYNG
jgi:4'-phosphopantetheinyl transferase